jgi:hypothetical protein
LVRICIVALIGLLKYCTDVHWKSLCRTSVTLSVIGAAFAAAQPVHAAFAWWHGVLVFSG